MDWCHARTNHSLRASCCRCPPPPGTALAHGRGAPPWDRHNAGHDGDANDPEDGVERGKKALRRVARLHRVKQQRQQRCSGDGTDSAGEDRQAAGDAAVGQRR